MPFADSEAPVDSVFMTKLDSYWSWTGCSNRLKSEVFQGCVTLPSKLTEQTSIIELRWIRSIEFLLFQYFCFVF